MKIIFFGTPDFSIPSLTSILDSNHELLLVITNPDKKSGRGLKTTFSPVKNKKQFSGTIRNFMNKTLFLEDNDGILEVQLDANQLHQDSGY